MRSGRQGSSFASPRRCSRESTPPGCGPTPAKTTCRSPCVLDKGRPAARIALLIPTFSYLAYAGTGTSAFRPLSLYSRHSDGSGVCYSSRLRPITNMRPKIQTNNPWQFMADTHLVDWLEVKGFAADFYTDEDLHFEGAAAARRGTSPMTATHPEDHSNEMLNGLGAHLQWWRPPDVSRGKRLLLGHADRSDRQVYRGAAARWHGALAGRPGRALSQSDGRAGRPLGFPLHGAAAVLGVGFTAQGFDRNSPYTRMPGASILGPHGSSRHRP